MKGGLGCICVFIACAFGFGGGVGGVGWFGVVWGGFGVVWGCDLGWFGVVIWMVLQLWLVGCWGLGGCLWGVGGYGGASYEFRFCVGLV